LLARDYRDALIHLNLLHLCTEYCCFLHAVYIHNMKCNMLSDGY